MLTIDSIFHLWRDYEAGKEWLERHFDDVLQLCTTSKSTLVKHLAKRWKRLHRALLEQLPDFALPDTRANEDDQNKADVSHLLDSPAFKYLEQQYEQAVSDNRQGYLRLQYASRQHKALLEWKIAATYFIGQLIPKYNSVNQLSYLLESASDDAKTMIGTRIEAGEALIRVPTAETWQTMISAFFIEPRTISGDYLLNWISYLTDFLSGEVVVLPPTYRSLERRPWVKKLSEISDDMLKELISG